MVGGKGALEIEKREISVNLFFLISSVTCQYDSDSNVHVFLLRFCVPCHIFKKAISHGHEGPVWHVHFKNRQCHVVTKILGGMSNLRIGSVTFSLRS